MPRYTKRIAGAAHQALPHRPAKPLLCRPWDLWSSSPAPQPSQGHAIPNTHSSDPRDHCWTEPLRPAKPAIHRHSRSLPGYPPQAHTGLQRFSFCQAMSLRPEQACTISAVLGHAPKACQAGDPHMHDLCHSAPLGLHRPAQTLLCWPVPLMPAQACTISTRTMPLKPAKLANHRHKRSSLCQPVPFRHARPRIQRPASSPQWKSSTIGLWEPIHLPPATGGLQTCLRDTHRQVWMLKE
jgi:hypothetical protein